MVQNAATVENLSALLDRIASAPLAAPWRMLAIVAVFLALALFGMAQLTFDDGTRSIFRSSNPDYAAYLEHVDAFAQSDTSAVILVESEQPISADQWRWQRDAVAENIH